MKIFGLIGAQCNNYKSYNCEGLQYLMLKTLVCQLFSTISNSLVCCEQELFVKDLMVLVWQHSRDCIMGVNFDVFLYRRNSMSFLYRKEGKL